MRRDIGREKLDDEKKGRGKGKEGGRRTRGGGKKDRNEERKKVRKAKKKLGGWRVHREEGGENG
jgi:hypothetical protein